MQRLEELGAGFVEFDVVWLKEGALLHWKKFHALGWVPQDVTCGHRRTTRSAGFFSGR